MGSNTPTSLDSGFVYVPAVSEQRVEARGDADEIELEWDGTRWRRPLPKIIRHKYEIQGDKMVYRGEAA